MACNQNCNQGRTCDCAPIDLGGAEKTILEGLTRASSVRMGEEWFGPTGWFSGNLGRAEALAAKHHLALFHFQRDAVYVFSRSA